MKRICATLALVTLLGCGGDDNSAPRIMGSPPDSVRVDEAYSFTFGCADPDGDAVEGLVGEGDTCGGAVTSDASGNWEYTFVPAADRVNTSCDVHVACSDGKKNSPITTTVQITPVPDITDLDFYLFSDWATPIEDYITQAASELGHMNFRASISELAVYDDALYLGYGDADLNLGRVVPIEVRYFTSPDASDLHSDFATDEEELSLYRQCDGMLIIPGVDATEDDLLGNVYTYTAGGEWYKSRTLEYAWHVHDTACYGGNIYAVGSGGTLDDYNNSTVNAFLWISGDGGETFTIAQQLAHPDPPGDQRLTQLLLTGQTLYAFGYYGTTSSTYAQAYQLNGEEFTAWTPPNFFTLDVWNLTPDLGIAVGVNIGTSLTYGAMYVTETGMEPVEALDGYTVYDIFPLGDGRALVLYTDGDTYPEPGKSSYGAMVGLLSVDGQLTLMTAQFFFDKPVSLAYWRGRLFMGLTNGQILMAEPTGK